MPSTTEQQRRFFGAVLAVKQGRFKGKPSKHLKEAASSMSVDKIKEFLRVKKKA